jgi:asparagine synthase (glutamine-hydrolysing)
MCGYIGSMQENPHIQNKDELTEMTNIITHRGPDDVGYYEDKYIKFGFRRLSIIDIEGGQQPLSYENERYWMVFNGEIYNYLELREELGNKGYQFATHSDSEVIIALYSDQGENAVKELRGMYSFVIWDKEKKEIFGARDPFGIKPFYYSEEKGRFYFGSEKKSILLARDKGMINHEALQHYLTYQYVPEPSTMSDSIWKLEPGHFLRKKIGQPLKIEKYWQASFQPLKRSKDEWTKEVRDVLFDSVQMHMRSDVPVGAFLSGGIDSTAIVSIAKEFHPAIKTFSVGFEHEGYSEVDLAKETAEKLGVTNIHCFIDPREFTRELPRIIWHMDDPLADPAAVPLYFVAREASKHVKVVLSGEGADELFGGYNIYREPQSLRMFSYLPNVSKRGLKFLVGQLPNGLRGKSFIERGCTPLKERYIGNAKMYTESEKRQLLKGYTTGLDYQRVTDSFYCDIKDYDDVNKMQYIDIHTWLRGDILLKADRMTMAHSLELRVPFLDKEVFKVASKLDSNVKITNQTTKYILREAVRGIVPDHVLNRKKLGFPVPIRHWLKNELYDWAVQLIHESQTDDLFHKKYVLNQLEEHRQGKMDHSRKIWTVLIFMIWHQIFIEKVYRFDEHLLERSEPELGKVTV